MVRTVHGMSWRENAGLTLGKIIGFSTSLPHRGILACGYCSLADRGNKYILIMVDDKSSYTRGIPMPRKTKLAVCTALDKAIARINSYSYRVARICSDDEAVLLSTTDHLGSRGIRISSTPADTHEHRVERKIQSVKSRRRALLCSLSYVLPRELEMESYLASISYRTPSLAHTTIPDKFLPVRGSTFLSFILAVSAMPSLASATLTRWERNRPSL